MEPILTDEQLLLVNRRCNDFEAAWKSGRQPRTEDVSNDLPVALRAAARAELLPLEVEYRARAGTAPTFAELAARFPDAPHDWLRELTRGPAVETVPEQLGDYRLVARLGGGGMGTVYKAVHQRMGRTVALKVLRPELQRDPRWLQRFEREVRAAARLTHPNVVAALDAREQDGLHYLITEFVDGRDLAETVRSQGPLPVSDAVDCIVQAARGLDCAHRQGLVHRDIKPANLLRAADGTVKVLDLGLARFADDEAGLTRTGMVMGTAAFMAPEQARDTHRADARSDIYSLGCTLFFLLTGRPVFSGASEVDTILSHVTQPVPSLAAAVPGIPPELEAAFRRLVAKDPAERLQTAAEVIAALEPFGRSPGSARTLAWNAPTLVRQITVAPRRRSRIWTASLLGGVLVVAALVLGSLRPDPPDFALEFDGETSYVGIPALDPVAGETYTLEAVVEPIAFRTSNVISWLGPDWMAIFVDSAGRWGVARRWRGTSILVSAKMPANLGTTVHLAGVFRGGEMQLFVDGEPVPTGPIEHPLPSTPGGLYLGGAPKGRLDEDRFFRGRIDEVRITRGSRYEGPFERPVRLPADRQTIAAFSFSEGQGRVTLGRGVRDWSGDVVRCTWVRTR